MDVAKVLVKGTSQHNDVVEVDQALRPLEASQDEGSIICWKVAGALHKPNGITRNWKRPSVVQNAVFGRSASSISTCQ